MNEEILPVLCIGLTPTVQRTQEFEQFRPDQVNRSVRTTVTAAGKGVNVALILHALGAPAHTLGFLGGAGGQVVEDYLAALGVPRTWIPTRAPTRTCVTVLDRSNGQVTELVEEAPRPEPDEWAALHACVDELLPRCDWLAISGALMPGAAPDTYARFVARAAALKIPVLIDSQQEPLRLALPYGPAVVKLNAHELAVTTGEPEGDDAAVDRGARKMLDKGAEAVFVTRGARSALLYGPGGCWELEPAALRAVNPIGSGDALTAGLLKGLLDGLPLPEAAACGMACGAANARTLTPSEVRREDVELLQAGIVVTRR